MAHQCQRLIPVSVACYSPSGFHLGYLRGKCFPQKTPSFPRAQKIVIITVRNRQKSSSCNEVSAHEVSILCLTTLYDKIVSQNTSDCISAHIHLKGTPLATHDFSPEWQILDRTLPLDGMLVHPKVTPSIMIAGTHSYTWVKRLRIIMWSKVSCLWKQHDGRDLCRRDLSLGLSWRPGTKRWGQVAWDWEDKKTSSNLSEQSGENVLI